MRSIKLTLIAVLSLTLIAFAQEQQPQRKEPPAPKLPPTPASAPTPQEIPLSEDEQKQLTQLRTGFDLASRQLQTAVDTMKKPSCDGTCLLQAEKEQVRASLTMELLQTRFELLQERLRVKHQAAAGALDQEKAVFRVLPKTEASR